MVGIEVGIGYDCIGRQVGLLHVVAQQLGQVAPFVSLVVSRNIGIVEQDPATVVQLGKGRVGVAEREESQLRHNFSP